MSPSTELPKPPTPIGRLAPSPTGAQHLGNARTYLIAWLSIRSRGGRIVMRIEDIDSPRVKPWATQQAIDDLHWLGLDWDEGPDSAENADFYVQTSRRNHYRDAVGQLLDVGRLYPCTCTRKDIEEAASAPHESIDGPVYPGICSRWTLGDPMPAEGAYCLRFRATEATLEFDDRLMGHQTCQPATQLGDFPIARKSGDPAYQLAVVIDDIGMGVNEVVRGDDLIPSTFRQLQIYDALQEPPPEYMHLPLVTGPDGRRLAKRHGDTRMSQIRDCGTSAEEVVGWALWTAGLIDRWEPVSATEFLPHYDATRLKTESSVLDEPSRQRLMRSR